MRETEAHEKNCGAVAPEVREKWNALTDLLRAMGRVVVAFSGGVDSSLLAALAHEVLGADAVAVTVISPLLADNEREDAFRMAEHLGMRHWCLEMNELQDRAFAANSADKCYLCKKMRFARMAAWAQEEGIPWLLDGSNAEDTRDYRPGMRALSELGVRSPLLEVGLGKAEVRAISRAMGLFTHDKPARACLASRLPYGEHITEAKLRQVDDAERCLASLFPDDSQFRVRRHGDVARIETDAAGKRALLSGETGERVYEAFLKLGFQYVALDLKGYRMGSLNESLRDNG